MNRRRTACYYSVVIPHSWSQVTRPSDGEHVGYLAPDGTDGLVVPTSLLGHPLTPAQDREDAVTLLRERGLASLDRRWWCRLPSTLPPSLVAAGEPGPGWEWRSVVLVEVSPGECTVRLEFGGPEEFRGRAALPVPVGDLLRTDPPA